MKCKHFKKLIPLFIDGELDERSIPEFQDHAGSCRDCREHLADYTLRTADLNMTLRSLADCAPASDTLVSTVISKIKMEQEGYETSSWFGRLWRAQPALAFSGMAAVLAVALILLFHSTFASLGKAQPQVVSGRRTSFTMRQAQDGRIDAGYTAKRFARIDARETGWKR